MDKFSFLGNNDINAIETLYNQYLEKPENIEESWRLFFEGYEFSRKNFHVSKNYTEAFDKEFNIINLIDDYRKRGHFFAKIQPVGKRKSYHPALDLEQFGLSNAELKTVFQAGKNIGIGPATLENIIAHLKQTYLRSIGVEYMYIRHTEVVKWLQAKMESTKNTPNFNNDERNHFFHYLKEAVGFEQFIHKKFVGQKRFSLEGAESLVPALNAVINEGAELGVEEFVIGISHRGRLNVLANVMQKPYEKIFSEFLGKQYDEEIELGDVKYHLGYNKEIITDKGKKVHLNLVPNPSHLETVDGVMQGISRAKINSKYNGDYSKLVPIVIHGDAAVASQGIVYEVIQMSQLNGYQTGGTIHLVINNLVGFTTNNTDARSSNYCTDIGKVTGSPIFHVNGDDAEALAYVIDLAMEYRQTFHTDIFIDIVCYRRYGHNEGDEPRFTQPILYQEINQHANPRDIYLKEIAEKGICSEKKMKQEISNFNDLLEQKLEEAKLIEKVHIDQFLAEEWKNYNHAKDIDFKQTVKSNVKKETLLSLAEKIHTLPEGKNFFKKLIKLMDDRKAMIQKDQLDWAICELLAYASLVNEGFPVRLSGQDSERGTFSHRHSVYTTEDTEEKYIPLQNLSTNQASFDVFNSPLSEYGVMGFEYGYALAIPNGLTIWEAQFGDFSNVAQAIIDQYISSAEDKWGLLNGLVLYLPHGYEGQGPEHSSARIERFLTLCAHNNMQITNCTTPANFFHLLRRQVIRNIRVPLVIFTPKSLLRHPKCTSSIEDLATNQFHEVIDDSNVNIEEVKRVVFCSGKVYYDLLEKKDFYEAKDIALIRLEQLYPFPAEQLDVIIAKYTNALKYLWVQEEPENMGAWHFIENNFKSIKLEVVARQASGSPAVGLHHLHALGQQEIIQKVFKNCDCELKNKYCGLQCVCGKSKEDINPEYQHFNQ